MKNLSDLGKALSKAEQQLINGGYEVLCIYPDGVVIEGNSNSVFVCHQMINHCRSNGGHTAGITPQL